VGRRLPDDGKKNEWPKLADKQSVVLADSKRQNAAKNGRSLLSALGQAIWQLDVRLCANGGHI